MDDNYTSLVMIGSTHFILAYAGDKDIKALSLEGACEIKEISDHGKIIELNTQFWDKYNDTDKFEVIKL